jgi:hypothetical protein
VAAALGRHARSGRDVRWTVIAWYAEAGRPVPPGQLAVPEPPWPAVREALVWVMRRSTAQRLVESARTAARGSEEEQDAFYTAAGRVVGRGHAGPAHPEVMRRVLEDPDVELDQGEDRRRRRGAVSMVAARAMGAGEVGGERLVDALATLMPGLDWTGVAADARQAEETGEFDGWIRTGAVDPLALLQAAGPEEMAAARHAARVLAGIGGLYLMHGLGMTDNPALARLRAVLEESGLSLIVAQMVPMMIDPSGIVHVLTMCLAPEITALAGWLESVLAEQAGTGQGLLRLPGAKQEGPEAFMQAWIGHLHQLADRARAHHTGTAEDTDGARPSAGALSDTGRAGSSTDGTDPTELRHVDGGETGVRGELGPPGDQAEAQV